MFFGGLHIPKDNFYCFILFFFIIVFFFEGEEGGAKKVNYRELENREWKTSHSLCSQTLVLYEFYEWRIFQAFNLLP